MESQVQLDDLEAELGDVAQAIRGADTSFHQAVVAARIRSFWDKAREFDAPLETKRACRVRCEERGKTGRLQRLISVECVCE